MILHTHITGEGEPLVLIHSGGMTGLTEFEEQNEYFSQKSFKVIRPDLRGHGKSEGSVESFGNHFGKDLNDTLEELQINQCHIAGVSLGGIAALMFAKEYPTRVKSLTFSGIFPIKPDNWDELTKAEEKHFEQLFNDEDAVSYLNKIHGNNDWKSLLRSFNGGGYPFNETGDVANLPFPTLCIVGGEVERELSAAISYKQLNPDIHISIIPFAGHLVHGDQPILYSETLYTFVDTLNKE